MRPSAVNQNETKEEAEQFWGSSAASGVGDPHVRKQGFHFLDEYNRKQNGKWIPYK